MLKVENTSDGVFFSSILYSFLSPKQELGRGRYNWLVASGIQYQLVLLRYSDWL